MIRAVLYDLDGTLLPMNQDEFVAFYFALLAKKAAPRGYEAKRLTDAIWRGTAAMVRNDGSRTNEEAFWQTFAQIFGQECLADKPLFEEFYRVEFQQAREACGFNPRAAHAVYAAKARGLRTVLATNPIFPASATHSRIRWAGLAPADFEAITTYENARFCKPNPRYYAELAAQIGLPCEECLMVGNDAREDTAAEEVGMRVFLLTDCLINSDGRDLSRYPRGGFAELEAFLRTL